MTTGAVWVWECVGHTGAVRCVCTVKP